MTDPNNGETLQPDPIVTVQPGEPHPDPISDEQRDLIARLQTGQQRTLSVHELLGDED